VLRTLNLKLLFRHFFIIFCCNTFIRLDLRHCSLSRCSSRSVGQDNYGFWVCEHLFWFRGQPNETMPKVYLNKNWRKLRVNEDKSSDATEVGNEKGNSINFFTEYFSSSKNNAEKCQRWHVTKSEYSNLRLVFINSFERFFC